MSMYSILDVLSVSSMHWIALLPTEDARLPAAWASHTNVHGLIARRSGFADALRTQQRIGKGRPTLVISRRVSLYTLPQREM